MTFTKWVGLLALTAGCVKQQDSVEFPVVYEFWGSASASLSATEDKGFLHIELKDDFKLIWTSLYLYGGPEDLACITEADMPDEWKEWILTNETNTVSQDLLEKPYFDGEHAWCACGGVSCLLSGYLPESEAERDRRLREWLRNIPTDCLNMSSAKFDVSRGYKDIGYITIILRCKDDKGVSRDISTILNRSDLKRLKVGE